MSLPQSVARREWPGTNEPDFEADNNAQLRRIATSLEKLAKVLDEFAGVFVNARFSGNGNDRWRRR
jgi:hypothetical protein